MLMGSTVLGLAYPAILGKAFDVLSEGAQKKPVLELGWLLLGTTVAAAMLGGAVSMLQTLVTARVLLDLRDRAFRSLQATSLEALSRRRLGDLMSRLGSDLNEVQQIATGTLLAMIGGVLTLAFAIAALIYIDAKLFGVAVLFLPPSLIIAAVLRRPIHSGAMKVKEDMADSASAAIDALRAQRLVRSLGTREIEAQRFHGANESLVRSVLGLQWLQAGSGIGAQLILAVTAFVVLLVGAARVRSGDISQGELVAFALYQARMYAPAQGLVSLYLNLQRARASVERVFVLMDPPPEQGYGQGESEVQGALTLSCQNLSVIRAGRPVVEAVSLEASPGKAVALVGRSGGGKSSLLDGLAGLAVRAGGTLLLGGMNVQNWSEETLRRRVALVDQEPLLRRGSVRDNLCYGLSWRVPEDVELRSRLAEVGLEHIDLDRELEEHGEGLSAGEARRLAMTRALLREPSILLLDEVGANLDSDSAEGIRRVVAKVAAERTVVLATHRKSELLLASHALWIEGGQVRGQGPPEEFAHIMDDRNDAPLTSS